MIEVLETRRILRDRTRQASFHLVAEKYVRIEFRNMKGEDVIGPFIFYGDIVATCHSGTFLLRDFENESTHSLSEMDQAVVACGTRVTIRCVTSGTLQLLWSPPHARTVQAFGP